MIQPALAADKVSLFKVITIRDEIVTLDSLRVEPYASPLKVLPIDEIRK